MTTGKLKWHQVVFGEWLRPLVLPNIGWLSLGAALALTLLGIWAMSFTSPEFAAKQAVFVLIALPVMALIAAPSHRRLGELAYPLLVVVMILLIVLLLPFMPREIVPLRNGARRWFNLHFLLFQPSELAKMAYVLSLASYLRMRENYRSFRGLFVPLLLTFIPMGLILVEPDLGTAMIFLPVFFAMMLAAGARLKHIVLIITAGLLLMPAMYPLLQPHQKQRIDAMVSQFRGETKHRDNIGFQGYTAQTLVGAGQLIGHDERHAANLIRYNRLPERHNDMIFAVIVNRFGALGGVAVIVLYLILIAGGLIAAAANREPFARLVAVGVTAVIFTQMFVNIGMTVGILPITGMTLPFVSYGGSSLVASYMMVGLVLSVAARRRYIFSHRYFEYDRPQTDPVQRNPAGANV